MATPVLSSSTDCLSNAPIAISDEEGDDQSSMWAQEEDQPADSEDRTFSDLPADFLEPLSPGAKEVPPLLPFPTGSNSVEIRKGAPENRQFWKSGDFAGSFEGALCATEGMDHARVHPKFLHSNATSHKWVLGAVAELLDNSVDEIRNGATFVKIDVQPNPRNGDPMLVIEDDGGGMDPDCMRCCMSLGYSAKSKIVGTIGQYGNGFKTSTMRLGADVIVFSRNQRNTSSESIGMISYTFLTSTGQNDVIIPIVDFQIEAFGIRKLIRSNADDWMESMQTIQDWSPYASQAELVNQFRSMPHRQGTKVIIYNLWEDEEGLLELDFDTDPHDIQIRSTSRDEKVLKLAAQFPSCRHYLTYKHSLRTYISILYLRLPARFKIFLRGTEVPHHSLQKEMMLVEKITYRPKDSGNSKAVVTLGFVKDAEAHIDISGFNVYHKNRLIRPFWRIWNISGIQGRGIIAILEANFVEPAHDKQGFERTIVLTRLEARLLEMQKSYWNKNFHMIGYTNASLQKTVRPHSKKSKAPSKFSVMQSNAHDVACAMKCVNTEQVGAKRAIEGAHDDNAIASEFSSTVGGLPAAMVQSIEETSSKSSIIERELSNLMPIVMASSLADAAKSSEILSYRQEPVPLEPSLAHTSQYLQNAPVDSRQTVVLNTTLNLPDLKSQERHTSCTTGITPDVIKLDPPDADKKFQDTNRGFPSPQNLDCQVEIISKEMFLKSTDTGNSHENSTQSVAAARLPTTSEAQELIDVSVCFPPLRDKVWPDMLISKSCREDDFIGKHYEEANTEKHCIESYVERNDAITATNKGCALAPVGLVKQCKEVQLEQLERCIEGPNTLVEGCKQAECKNHEKILPENGVGSALYVPTTIKLDDRLDNLEKPLINSPSIKNTEAFVQSPISEIEMTLPDQEENGACKSPLLSPANVHGGNEGDIDVRNEDAITELGSNNIIMPEAECKIFLKESALIPQPPESVIDVLPDTNKVTVDENGQEHNEPVGTEQVTRSDHERMEHQQMDKNMAVILWDDTDLRDHKNSSMSLVERQEHETITSSNIENGKDSLTAAVDQHRYESMAVLKQNGTTLHYQNDSQGSIQASCLDIVSIPTTAMADVVIGSVVDNLSRDLLKEERLVVAEQQIDYLQRSIKVIVVEVDDLKEQLQQERELQQTELGSLNMDLERALLRLEELMG